MHTFETTGVVTRDHELLVRSTVPQDVSPGEHIVQVTLDPAKLAPRNGLPFFRSAYCIGLSGDNITFRREDIYEDVDR